MRGSIYFAINSAMPGLVKIGRTNSNVRKRLGALRTTGVPAHFEVFAMFAVTEAKVCEAEIHKALALFRVEGDREFFKLESAEALRKSWPIIDKYLFSNSASTNASEEAFGDLQESERKLLESFGEAPSYQRPNGWEWVEKTLGFDEIDSRHFLHTLSVKQYLKETNTRPAIVFTIWLQEV
jgi:hypothetical protein